MKKVAQADAICCGREDGGQQGQTTEMGDVWDVGEHTCKDGVACHVAIDMGWVGGMGSRPGSAWACGDITCCGVEAIQVVGVEASVGGEPKDGGGNKAGWGA